MRLYNQERVIAAEATDEFATALATAKALSDRQQAGRKAVREAREARDQCVSQFPKRRQTTVEQVPPSRANAEEWCINPNSAPVYKQTAAQPEAD